MIVNNCVLIVDDDVDFARSQEEILAMKGYQVKTVFSIPDAKKVLDHFEVNVALLDIHLGTGSGLELIPEIRRRYPKSLCVMLTAFASVDSAVSALQQGAYDYIRKPFRAEDLFAMMARCFERIRLKEEKFRAVEKIKQRTAELSRLNEELSAFAHSMSHDLKAPLRAIEGFSNILLEDYGKILDQQGNEYLNEIRRASVRMAHLIEDLLIHARMGEKFSVATSVKLSEIINRAVMNLSSDIGCSKANIKAMDNLPVIMGHRATLEILMQNLVSNAIKFVSPSTKPVVYISAVELPSEFQITISDNGIGIEKTRDHSIFKIFERLHTEDEYPGTGIGLAIAKKIVTLHKGSIWLDSKIGVGSQFHFTISKSLAEQPLAS